MSKQRSEQQSEQRIHLLAADVAWLPVRAGTLIVSVAGAVQIGATPRTLAEHSVTVRTRLDQGEAYACEESGWVQVHALADATVLVERQLGTLRTRLQRWFAALTREPQRIKAPRLSA